MDVLSIVILAAVIVAAAGCVWKLIRDRKRGRTCCGDCSNCRGCDK